MSRLLLYLIIMPLSRLSIPWIYRVSDGLCFLLYRVIRYRRTVVRGNLTSSFPDKTPSQIREIERLFYQHVSDLILESVKQFSISREDVLAHCRVVNPELLVELGKSHPRIIVAAGHYGNWELTSVALGMCNSFTVHGIYTPLKDVFMDRKLMVSRERYGMRMLSRHDIKAFASRQPEGPEVILFATDQTPSNVHKCYWMEFLGQETPVFFGTEKFAVEQGWPVVFGRIVKPRRGYYELSFELLEEHPRSAPYGRITRQHTRALEEEIRNHPPHWLWTHKRWKRTRPQDVPLHK
ncbi:MAG: lysophospholipid acyltransferase family protein [Saprospiraceae bacterium]|nr:lysophospholipid acyltransferase family protein [Saprospiraceae bacterium]